MVRNAGDGLSYFGESKKQYYSEPGLMNAKLEDAARALHALVGNAVTKGSHIVVGNGSTQLFQAALYALTSSGCLENRPPLSKNSTRSSTAVVAQSPYYSDLAVAKKMAEFVFLTTIGVSRDARSHAARIVRAVVRGYEIDGGMEGILLEKQLFHWAMAMMECQWGRVRAALARNKQFSLLESLVPSMCTFLGMAYSTYPAFIWLKCEDHAADCRTILKRNGILACSGVCFGVSPQYACLSLLDRKPAVDLLIKRLAALKC